MSETNGHSTTLSEEQLHTMSVLLSRLGLAARAGQGYEGKRDLYDLFGWKKRLDYLDFKALYRRQALAYRVVRAYPEAAWAQPPEVKEIQPTPALPPRPPRPVPVATVPGLDGPQSLVMNAGDPEPTAFEQAWQDLAQRLHIYALLQRTDILANLGQYAILLIGLAGQSDPLSLQQPARPVRGPEDVLYLMPYSEEFARVVDFEDDPNSPDYAKPRTYEIQTGTIRSDTTAKQPAPRLLRVHASHVIHVAFNCLDDEVYGAPRLEAVYNAVSDAEKILGSDAEMWFRDAKRRIVVQTQDGYTVDQADAPAIQQEIEEFMYQWRDFIRLTGMDAKVLTGTIVSPKEHLAACYDQIATATKIPKRELTGSERGELSSEQDDQKWKGDVTAYQRNEAEPKLLRPLIDRFIGLRALPIPRLGYEAVWENLFSLSEEKQAQVAKDIATAIAQFAQASSTGAVRMSFERFLDAFLHLDPEDDPWYVEVPMEELLPARTEDTTPEDETDDAEEANDD